MLSTTLRSVVCAPISCLRLRNATNQCNFIAHIRRSFDKNEAACVANTCRPLLGFPKNAVHRHSQRGGFPVHRASTADDQIRAPDQVHSVDDMLWHDNLAPGEEIGPPVPQLQFLFHSPRKDY